MIKPCPCGETPKKLCIEPQESYSKFAYVTGDCCGDWQIEFRLNYKNPSSEEGSKLALEAWNMTPRGNNSAFMKVEQMDQKDQLGLLLSLITMSRELVQISRESGLDGPDLQEFLVRHGVLEEKQVTELCGENCICAEYGAFPKTCNVEAEFLNIVPD